METMTATPAACLTQQKADTRSGKYLTFCLGNEEFAIQVLRVREIMGVLEINAVPQTPDYVKGVVNLRGKVIPVVDLRLKFGLAEMEYTQRTCIIVVQIEAVQIETVQIEAGQFERAPVQGGRGHLQIGIIVDAVSEVLTLQASDIENTPDFGSGVAIPYLLGMAKIKGQVKILLDINRVLSAQEAAGLRSL
jgi:purine-binding chemotaxis protein CheW